MTRSEESITLMTPYRFSLHGYRSFTFVQDDAQRFPPHYDDFHATVILNGDKNALWKRREME